MFGMTNSGRCRCGSANPLEDLEHFTSGLFGLGRSRDHEPKLDFELDVRDEGDAFVLEADLPGMRREDLHVDLAGDYLTISAQRGETRTEETGDSGSYLRRERSFGRVQRTFDVSEVDTDAITASYRSGVLSLRLPKLHQAEPDVRHVDIQ